MSAFALGGRAGWRIAATTCLEAHGALTAAGAGTYVSQAFDSQLPGCRWDRVRFDAALPDGTSIAISTFTSESERSAESIAVLTEADWSAWTSIDGPQLGPTDALIRAAPGRYLWIRLDLTGTAVATAAVRWLDITYPRSTSVRMLPAVFSTSAGGADITERLLSIFDAMRFGVTDEIRLLASVIDPRTTDAGTKRDFLDWLGGWFGLEMFRAWPERRRRAVIGAAGSLFRRRGTPDGIRHFIRLALGIEVQIVEDFAARAWWFAGTNPLGCGVLFGPQIARRALLDSSDRIGDVTLDSAPAPYLDPFSARANRMTVIAPFGHEPSAEEIAMLRAVVDIQKPAHVAACIEIVVPDLRLSVRARLGCDSVLGALHAPAILAGSQQPHLDAYVLGGSHS